MARDLLALYPGRRKFPHHLETHSEGAWYGLSKICASDKHAEELYGCCGVLSVLSELKVFVASTTSRKTSISF